MTTKEMFELPDGLLTADAGNAAEEWAARYFEVRDMLRDYQAETDACYRLANELDNMNPGIRQAYCGNPSERIHRQLVALKILEEG